ncbi:MAG: phosphomannomutase/phosphoglucomutase [Canidatus Methanoxibalbensis ujae]|nr:phosphomannomutase/phosphoglucomutase [Candidatus Methanoxibalbensis ujae]MCW7078470.1 phosphomannomutase/phosphoglucomutase [Candidatus Methanoxibalbensis ujae]
MSEEGAHEKEGKGGGSMIIDESTYRANDIRGIADENHPDFQLSDEFCEITAHAFVEMLRKYRGKEPEDMVIVVGKDVRLSSPRIKSAFENALIQRGVRVVDIAPSDKVSSTPLMYFATWLFNADGGVEVTGSHLEKEWNGFKLCVGSESTTETHIKEMFRHAKRIEESFLRTGRGALPRAAREGEKADVSDEVFKKYHDMIVANVVLRSKWEELALKSLAGEISLSDAIGAANEIVERLPEDERLPLAALKVVYDAGNGTTGIIAPPIFRDLGADVFCLYCEPDGNFPHHLPDPTIPRFLDDLRAEVRRRGAHIGLASDADGDRAGAVSPSGRMIIGEQILALLCKHILSEHPDAKIVFDTKCSDAIREIILENGGVPVEWKTGFSFIKAKMAELDAIAGGEMSGHVYFKKNNRADDAVFAFSELLLLVSRELRRMRRRENAEWRGGYEIVDELLSDFFRYVNTPELRVPVVNDAEKNRVCDIVESYFRELAAKHPEKYRRRTDDAGNDIDGVKIEFLHANGWALIRRSNTSPVIIMRMEAVDEKGLREVENEVISKLMEFDTVDLEHDEYVRGILRRLRQMR